MIFLLAATRYFFTSRQFHYHHISLLSSGKVSLDFLTFLMLTTPTVPLVSDSFFLSLLHIKMMHRLRLEKFCVARDTTVGRCIMDALSIRHVLSFIMFSFGRMKISFFTLAFRLSVNLMRIY